MTRRSKIALVGWRSELLYLAMAGIEIFSLTPWFMVFAPGAAHLSGGQTVLFIALNIGAALLIVRVTTRRRAPDPIVQAAFVGGLITALAVTLRFVLPADSFGAEAPLIANGTLIFSPLVISAALVALFWYRGLRIATLTVTPVRASYSLRVGIIVIIVAAALPNERIQRAVLLLLPAFFFCGLLAASLARSASLRTNRETQRSSFGLGWIGFTALLGAALSLIGFVVALLIAGFQFDGILAALGQVISGVMLVVATLLLPLFNFLASLIDFALRTILNRTDALHLFPPQGVQGMLKGPQNPLAQQVINYLPLIGFFLVSAVLLIGMLIVLRNRSRVTLREGEERESLDNAAILNSLRATLQQGLDTLRDALDSLSRFGNGAAAAFTIRRLYARMSALAAQRGYPRATAQTPYEYQPLVTEAFPDFEREIGLITHAYVNVHYGELPDDPAIITTALAALERMAAEPAR